MLRDFFKTAVVGPIAAEPLSIAGSCAHCVAASAPGLAHACAGFGPGCLSLPSSASRENLTGVNRRGYRSPLD